MITWQLFPFEQLNNQQLYALFRLRIDVFVVEQNCAYAELDGKDTHPDVWHLLGYRGEQLVACARLLPPGISYDQCSIGRVVVHPEARGEGLSHQLLSQAIKHCHHFWPNNAIEIGAQAHLTALYQQHGFQPVSEPYLEDGIPHVDMRK